MSPSPRYDEEWRAIMARKNFWDTAFAAVLLIGAALIAWVLLR